MPMNILMPALSPTMETGTLAKWLVAEGDKIKAGQVIAEIETDKATMEYETADEGIMGKIVVAAGTEDVKVGTLIGMILEEGESISDAPSPALLAPSPVKGEGQPALPSPLAGEGGPKDRERALASPLARRMAEQLGIDLASIKGTGPGGRIIKADLDKSNKTETLVAPTSVSARPEPVEGRSPAAPTDIPHSEIKLTNMRKTIARRLTESKQNVPHIYLTIDCTLDKLLMMRKDLNARMEKQGIKLSVNDIIIKAVALALKKVPAANVQYAGDVMRQFTREDISVAVSIPSGLITPIIKDAANKGLATISSEMLALAKKAKDGKLQPDEYQGGTFSISNMGMMGIKDFCAVINPPQAGILAIGAGEQRAIVVNGEIKVATVMSVTGSFDHRAIDGAVGAEFLNAFRDYIEEPMMMLA
jgi:pyruvate dehydrogenase E2 component (dihydrolipoamide acetyltransferase)